MLRWCASCSDTFDDDAGEMRCTPDGEHVVCNECFDDGEADDWEGW